MAEQQLPKQMSPGLWYVGAPETLAISLVYFICYTEMIRTDEVTGAACRAFIQLFFCRRTGRGVGSAGGGVRQKVEYDVAL